MMQEPVVIVVPDAGIYTPPVCGQCGIAFAHDDHRWIQECACPSSDGMFRDGRWRAVTCSPPITFIGQPRWHSCILCRQSLADGERAMLGQMGPHDYVGYAHIACYEHDQARVAAAQAEARAAAQGVQITVWYGPDAALRPVAATGHADAHVRTLPAELPDLPAGSVVYNELRRPVAKARIAFPEQAAAELWWVQATANRDASYELYWFEPGVERSRRDWRGHGFSTVESRAQIAELLAQPEE